MCLGDIPALNWLGGFKESVSKAHKFCRTCEIENDKIETHIKVSDLRLRDLTCHKSVLKKLEDAKINNKLKEHIEISKKHGINYKSCLLNLKNFDVTKGLLHDPMHVLFEGICHLELKCFLNDCLNTRRLFSLQFLNEKIKAFKYFKVDISDVPNVIDLKNISAGVFTQTAAQMKTLYHNLPLMLGSFFDHDNENWINMIRMINIINLVFSYLFTERTIEELKNEVEKYLINFLRLYPEINITPKMHTLLHFPDQMRNFGPLRLHSTFRFESKNGSLKNIKYKNFKNICKSVSYKEELLMLAKRFDSNCLIRDDVINKGIEFIGVSGFENDEVCPLSHKDLKICSEIKLNGFTYNQSVFLILKDDLDNKNESIGKITNLFILDETRPAFRVTMYKIIDFVTNKNCYKVAKTNITAYFLYDDLAIKQPVFGIEIGNDEQIVQIRYFYYILN